QKDLRSRPCSARRQRRSSQRCCRARLPHTPGGFWHPCSAKSSPPKWHSPRTAAAPTWQSRLPAAVEDQRKRNVGDREFPYKKGFRSKMSGLSKTAELFPHPVQIHLLRRNTR